MQYVKVDLSCFLTVLNTSYMRQYSLYWDAIMLRYSIKTKSQLAYEYIKEEISSAEFSPGTKLVIHSLASKYGISDSPIREALRRLEAEGVVKNTPHVSYVVTEADFTELDKVFEVRQLLEGHATWLAARHITSPALSYLRDIVEKMNACGRADAVLYSRLNTEFHDVIYSSCGNTVLYEAIKQTVSMAPRTKSIFALANDRIISSLREHKCIYQYLKDGNAEKAKEALLIHKRTSYDILLTK